jgi:hypothetical protein
LTETEEKAASNAQRVAEVLDCRAVEQTPREMLNGRVKVIVQLRAAAVSNGDNIMDVRGEKRFEGLETKHTFSHCFEMQKWTMLFARKYAFIFARWQ